MPYDRYKRDRRRETDEPVRVGPLGHFIDNHIRSISAILTILVIIGIFPLIEHLIALADGLGETKFEGREVTLDELCRIDDARAPVWQDFQGRAYTLLSNIDDEEAGRYEMREYAVSGGGWVLYVGGDPTNKWELESVTLYRVGDAEIHYELDGSGGLRAFLEKHAAPAAGPAAE